METPLGITFGHMQLGLMPTQLQGSSFTTNAPALWQAHQEPDPHSLVMTFTVILEIQAENPILIISTLIVCGTTPVSRVSGSTCCDNPDKPWFKKKLSQPANEDVELRWCGNEPTTHEATATTRVELYVRVE